MIQIEVDCIIADTKMAHAATAHSSSGATLTIETILRELKDHNKVFLPLPTSSLVQSADLPQIQKVVIPSFLHRRSIVSTTPIPQIQTPPSTSKQASTNLTHFFQPQPSLLPQPPLLTQEMMTPSTRLAKPIPRQQLLQTIDETIQTKATETNTNAPQHPSEWIDYIAALCQVAMPPHKAYTTRAEMEKAWEFLVREIARPICLLHKPLRTYEIIGAPSIKMDLFSLGLPSAQAPVRVIVYDETGSLSIVSEPLPSDLLATIQRENSRYLPPEALAKCKVTELKERIQLHGLVDRKKKPECVAEVQLYYKRVPWALLS